MKHPPRVFYGWWLVLACLVISAITAGSTGYSYSLFAVEVEQTFSANRAQIMMGMTGLFLMQGLMAPKLGSLMDRYSIKWTLIASTLLMGSGFILMSFSANIWNIVGIYTLLIPAGASAGMMLLTPLLLSRWFVKKRGLAVGIAGLGTNLGGFIFPPVVASFIELYEWRFTMRAVGLFAAVVIPVLAYWLIIDRPSDEGLVPDGEDAPLRQPTTSTAPSPPLSSYPSEFKKIMTSRLFWLCTTGVAVVASLNTVLVGNIALFAADIGMTRDDAALLIALFAISGMIASPLVGHLCDTFRIATVLAALMTTNIVALACYALTDSYQGLALGTAIAAIGSGGVIPFAAAMIGRLFDIRLYGRIYGTVVFVSLVTAGVVPILSGWLFDATGSYRMMFLAFIVVMTIPLCYSTWIRQAEIQMPNMDAR